MVICTRCNVVEATLVSRKEPFCDGCFVKFIQLKQRKQMMSDEYFQDIFKMAYPDRKRGQEEADKQNAGSTVLVPLSLGSASLAVLDILHETLLEHKETHRGKTGFQLEVLTLCDKDSMREVGQKIDALKSRYSSNSDKMKYHIIDRDQFFKSSSSLQEFSLNLEDYGTFALEMQDDTTSVDEVLASAPNRTSKEDLSSIINTHLIKKFALQRGVKAVLWGHSMTKLADEIITLTVKGRGSEIASYMDNSTLDVEYDKAFRNLHPARDILLSEIDAYCHIKKLDQFCHEYVVQDTLFYEKFVERKVKNVKLIKNMTMNELARQYFDNIEGDYSNVISTVVRTGAKLANPIMELANPKRCAICNAVIYKSPSTWLEGITVNKPFTIQNEEEESYYKAWKDANPEMKDKFHDIENGLFMFADVCYGCITTLTGMKERKVNWIRRDDAELISVLEEFELSSDDESF